MRSATLWILAASLAALALLVLANDRDKKKMELLKKMSSCCRTTKKLLAVFHYGGITCGGIFVFDKLSTYFMPMSDPEQLAPQLQDGCLVYCIFGQNNFLMPNKTIDHVKLKREFMKEIDDRPQDVKPVVETAIDKCFKLVEENEERIQNVQDNQAQTLGEPHARCRQAPQLVLTCIAGFTLLNCPKSDWKDDHSKCSGKRESLKQDIINLEREQIAEMQKNDPTIEFTPKEYAKMGLVRPKVLRVKTADEMNQEQQQQQTQS